MTGNLWCLERNSSTIWVRYYFNVLCHQICVCVEWKGEKCTWVSYYLLDRMTETDWRTLVIILSIQMSKPSVTTTSSVKNHSTISYFFAPVHNNAWGDVFKKRMIELDSKIKWNYWRPRKFPAVLANICGFLNWTAAAWLEFLLTKCQLN